jgi:hypothetical protein
MERDGWLSFAQCIAHDMIQIYMLSDIRTIVELWPLKRQIAMERLRIISIETLTNSRAIPTCWDIFAGEEDAILADAVAPVFSCTDGSDTDTVEKGKDISRLVVSLELIVSDRLACCCFVIAHGIYQLISIEQ